VVLFALSLLPHVCGVPGGVGELTEGQSCLRSGKWDHLPTLWVELVQSLYGDLYSGK
jgi:hypothetical protein